MKLTKKEILLLGPIAKMVKCFSIGRNGPGYMITPVMLSEIDYIHSRFDAMGVGKNSKEKTTLAAIEKLVEYGAVRYDQYSTDAIKFTMDDQLKLTKIIAVYEQLWQERQLKLLDEVPEEIKPKRTRKKKESK